MNEHEAPLSGTIIKVIGVGGAGGNAVNHMAASGIRGVEFICANTDAQALKQAVMAEHIQLGESGLGAGSNPEVGRDHAIRERTRIAQALHGAHMVFVTAGMGGGTGTGAAPVIAEVAKELGILTVGVVSKPFGFEGQRRGRVAEEGLARLEQSVDSLIIVLNDRLEEVLGDDVTQKEAFRAADDVLRNAVAGISDIINVSGMVNVDFQDVRTVMKEMGVAMMGTGKAAGDGRARRAAEEAIACPLLDGTNLTGARGILVNISASSDTMRLRETREVLELIQRHAGEDAVIKFGAVFDDSLGDEMNVTVVATGLVRPESQGGAAAQPAQGLATAAPQGQGQGQPSFQSHLRQATQPAQDQFLRVRSGTGAPAPAAAPAGLGSAPVAPAAPAAQPVRLRQSEATRPGNPTSSQPNFDVPPFLRHGR